MSLSLAKQLESRWPHRWAWLLVCATFPLIWWGGLVTSTDAGMAFRDWLTSDGHFMPFYPWLSSTGDKFIEHGHRLLGMLVGVLSIGLVVVAYVSRARPTVHWLSLILLAGVICQGVLGGLRVVLDERTLAMVHGCTGPLFFAICTAMVVITSRHWQTISSETRTEATARLMRVALVTAGLAYLQLVLGAIVRHTPHMIAPIAAKLFQTAVYFHLMVAALIIAYVLTLAWQTWRAKCCRMLGISLAILIGCQVALGAATWFVKYGIPRRLTGVVGDHTSLTVEGSFTQAAIVTSHVAVGSLIVAVSAAIALIAVRSNGWRTPHMRAATKPTGQAKAEALA